MNSTRVMPLLLLAALWLPAPGMAAELTNLQAGFGKSIYELYCAACHGRDGRGNGPAAALLSSPPSDLTVISRNNGGSFPRERVTDALNGVLDIAGHLDLDLPPWATHEFESFPAGTILDAMIERRIAHIVSYIESIQEQP